MFLINFLSTRKWRILINIYLESYLDEPLLAIGPDEMVVG
jgi:hypothetical protein